MAFVEQLPDANRPKSEMSPYDPEVPASLQRDLPELFDYLTTTIDMVRKQHVKIQAGDTTLTWQVLLALDSEARYTLGSTGKFSHPDFGLFAGVYVQFESMNAALPAGSPAAFVRQNTWVVTNRLDKSGDQNIRGLIAAYQTPTEGQFGWLITRGVNLAALRLTNSANLNDYVTWESDGTLAVSGSSYRAVGRVISESNQRAGDGEFWLGAGAVRVSIQNADFAVGQVGEIDIPAGQDYSAQLDQLTGALAATAERVMASVNLLSRRVAALGPNAASVSEVQRMNAIINFSNLSQTAARNTAGDVQLVSVKLAATQESERTTRVYRDQSGFYSESALTSMNSASISANEGAVSAAASQASYVISKASADQAGVYAETARGFRDESQAAIGTTQANAIAAQDYSTRAGNSAAEAHASEVLAAQYRDEAQAVAGADLTAVNARITNEANASVSRDSANANRIDSVETGYKSGDSKVVTDLTKYADDKVAVVDGKVTGVDSRVTLVNNRVTDKETESKARDDTLLAHAIATDAQIVTDRTASSDRDGALATRIDATIAAYKAADTVLGDALGTQIVGVDTAARAREALITNSVVAVDARVTSVAQASVDRDGAISTRIDSVDASYKAADMVIDTRVTGVDGRVTAVDSDARLREGVIKESVVTTNARVTSEAQASSDRDGALGTRIDTTVAGYKSADTALGVVLLGQISDVDTATRVREGLISQSIVTVDARVTSESTASADRDGALGTRIDSTVAAYKAADVIVDNAAQTRENVIKQSVVDTNARVTSESTASANRDGALGTRIDTVVASYTSLDSRVTTVDGDSRTRDGLLSQDIVTANARITSEAAASADRDGALGRRVDTVSADYKIADAVVDGRVTAVDTNSKDRDAGLTGQITTVNARVTTEAQASANRDGALGVRIDSVVARAGNLEASTSITQTAIADLKTQDARARLELTALSPGGRAAVVIRSDINSGGGIDLVGDVAISGSLLVAGTITSLKIDRNTFVRIGASAWSGSVVNGSIGSESGIPGFLVSLGQVYGGGFYTLEVLMSLNKLLVGTTQTRNGKPYYRYILEDGGVIFQFRNEDNIVEQEYLLRDSRMVVFTALDNGIRSKTVNATLRRGNTNTGIIDDGDYYYSYESQQYQITELTATIRWSAI